ncbi:hypothetical protein Ddye_026684 [Dipteronia dyeriana]|uniref:Myb/SANT-like domain-containing protein n=1 Tax=Dipteronia dyeriana TaxID=168575 RepID=A0AAD9TMM3_9ROSI|nr:hypothetical protein Ddye_026684 [Dipteronia dyeriana]
MARASDLTTLQLLCFHVSPTINLKFLESVFDCEILETNGNGNGTRLQSHRHPAAISYNKFQMEKSMNKLISSESVSSGSRGSKAIWDSQSVDFFCDLCIKEVEQGHRPVTHFTKVGWDNLVKNFYKTTRKEYNKVQLKNRWDTLKSNWKLWRDLVGKETGLGWNAKLKTIDASEEWWHRKL